mgnify:CR=1 FL=1
MDSSVSESYQIVYYVDRKGREPVKEYIKELPKKERAKIFGYIDLLKESRGYLDEPYAKHIKGKIRELRIDFSRNRHRIFYFVAIGKTIILLHAFLKKTPKTPPNEIQKAAERYEEFQRNQ